ncbi:unnamed protein product [Clavelina lepadiformis]|uniref:Uncharacterized protein n=1 Tax=Clavelina lepadiformis TaxID=159417 RepID=A0ABP0GL77_CLALP
MPGVSHVINQKKHRFARSYDYLLLHHQTMECHPDNMRVDVLLKAISDMVSQEFKSMRLDMQIEETKETETMNNAMSHRINITTISVRSQVCVFPRLPLPLYVALLRHCLH